LPSARIGIGASIELGDATANVRAAIRLLARAGTVARISSLYRTKPWGRTDQSDFVNAAVALETQLEPRELLTALKAIERELGRTPSVRWGPRAIDLDILTYDDRSIDEAGLVVPHRHLYERAFALVPLAEIDPRFRPALDALPAPMRAEVVRLEA